MTVNNEQYTNIMVAIAEVKTRQEGTNHHLKTLNGKVADNIKTINGLQKAESDMANSLSALTGESESRKENNQWYKRHLSAIVISGLFGLATLILQVTGIVNISI